MVSPLSLPWRGSSPYDVDFAPAVDADNLDRLSAALDDLDARIRTAGVPEGLAFAHDGTSLGRSTMWNLQCRFGAFDITFEPSGGGYDHLARRAHVVAVRGVAFTVADLADVVASKSWPTAAKTSWSCRRFTRRCATATAPARRPNLQNRCTPRGPDRQRNQRWKTDNVAR